MTIPTASFDVFDTVLTRIWAEPRDLFARLGEVALRKGLSNLDPGSFASERMRAERNARLKSPSREASLRSIYLAFGLLMNWTDSQREATAALEIELEVRGIRPVPGAKAVVDSARLNGASIAFLSDMYLPTEVVTNILASAGIYQDGDLVLVSGDVGVGKGNGALFEHASGILLADFGAWTHTGDNWHADCEVPTSLGIVSHLTQVAQLSNRERILRGDDRMVSPCRSLIAGAGRLARLSQPDAAVSDRSRALWNMGSDVTGPLFWAYTDWCLKEAEKRGIGDLYFLARGGQIFFRIAQLILEHRPMAIRLHYMYASRIAFSGIADSENPAYIRKLVAAPLAFHSFNQALANVGVSPDADLAPPGLPRNEWGRNLTNAERSAIADWMLQPDRLSYVKKSLLDRRRLAATYLRQIGLDASGSIGLVDTGWMGTIQKNIEFLRDSASNRSETTGFYLGLSSVREFECRGEMLAYTNTFAPLPFRRETTHLILLELMARGTHGPLVGFDEKDGLATPRLGPSEAESIREIQDFQNSVLSFTRTIVGVQDQFEVDHAAIARLVIGAYREFFRHPTLAEALALGRTRHADQMLEESYSELCPRMTLGRILAAMADFSKRPPGWWLYGQATQGHSSLLRVYVALKRAKWWIRTSFLGHSD